MGVGHDGGGPVDQRPPVAVDEQVERVKIAVADDPLVVSGGAEMFGHVRKVRPADGGRLCGDALEEVADVGLAGVAGEFAVQPVERTFGGVRRRLRRGGRGVGEAGSELA